MLCIFFSLYTRKFLSFISQEFMKIYKYINIVPTCISCFRIEWQEMFFFFFSMTNVPSLGTCLKWLINLVMPVLARSLKLSLVITCQPKLDVFSSLSSKSGSRLSWVQIRTTLVRIPAKIVSPFLPTAPLQWVLKIRFTQATIDCLTTNKTTNALCKETVI